MTTIVGMVDRRKGCVVIGGDSQGTGGWHRTYRADPKVFSVGEFIFGCTSSYRMTQIIKYRFKPPAIAAGTELHAYMCTEFVTELHKAFKEFGYEKKLTDGEAVGGTFMVGIRDRLFMVQNDFQVQETEEDFDACGSGELLAIGCLHGFKLIDHHELQYPESAIRHALNSAAHYNIGTGGKHVFSTTEGWQNDRHPQALHQV